MTVIPLYKVVEEHIRTKINAGALAPGDLIPSEPQLAKTLEVSQGTVKKAIDNLVRERLLYRHQGKGTYVSRIDFNNSLFRFFAYGNQVGDGVRIHKQTPTRKVKRAPADICRRLNLDPGSRLLYIERVGYVEEDAVLVEDSWWNMCFVSGLEDESIHIPDLMYAVVEEKFQVPVLRAEETLTAEAADKRTAQRLGIEVRDPVVVLMRVTFTSGNRPVEFRITRGRADRFSYKTEIR